MAFARAFASTSTSVPNELERRHERRQQQTDDKYHEHSADIGDCQGVGVLASLVIDRVALTRTAVLLPPLVTHDDDDDDDVKTYSSFHHLSYSICNIWSSCSIRIASEIRSRYFDPATRQSYLLGEIAPAQAISPAFTHFSIAWSVVR